ncbi:MAG TPA: hypothetical protein VFK09_10695 [Gemmatimonadales bacterium]|nr:hypothetical protein [Gemmatimonadales bacterium]
MRALPSLCFGVCAGAVVTACSADGPTSASPRADRASLTPAFLSPAPSAPEIANPVVSFYAKRGEKRSGIMVYHARPGERDSTEFLRFEVHRRSLLVPDGDSVLITMTLVDPKSMIVEFQPAGLQFNPDDPAEAEFSYREANPDVDGDGIVDAQDTLLTPSFRIWKQETATDPWVPLSSDELQDLGTVVAPITGFTRYAIAY